MAVICTKCGSTDVLCEALVNPNTEKVVSYHDGAFMYGFCENCKDESVITDTNGIKCDMENCITINMKTAFIIKMETYMLDN